MLTMMATWKVALVIIQSANSLPPFIGQSFASSSITDSSGKTLSKSVYADSTGRRIGDGVAQLDIDLLPPFLPNQIPLSSKNLVPTLSLEVEPPPLPANIQRAPLTVPTTARTTVTTTARPTTTTQRPTTARVFQPIVNNFIQHNNLGGGKGAGPVNNEGAYKFKAGDDGQYRLKGSDDGKYRVKGNDGIYRPKGNLGYYVHNNAGKYVHDNRGKYINW